MRREIRFLKKLRQFIESFCEFLGWFCFETPLLVISIVIGVLVFFIWGLWYSSNYDEISTESYQELQALAAEYPEEIRPLVLSALESEKNINGRERREILNKYNELVKGQISRCEPPRESCEKTLESTE